MFDYLQVITITEGFIKCAPTSVIKCSGTRCNLLCLMSPYWPVQFSFIYSWITTSLGLYIMSHVKRIKVSALFCTMFADPYISAVPMINTMLTITRHWGPILQVLLLVQSIYTFIQSSDNLIKEINSINLITLVYNFYC